MPDALAADLERMAVVLARMQRELEFHNTVTEAMLGTLDLDQVLYVILSGITSGDGLGLNRACLFLEDDAGRSLRARMALGPRDRADASKIWEDMVREGLDLRALTRRYEAYRHDARARHLMRRMSSFALPLCRVGELARAADDEDHGQGGDPGAPPASAPLAGLLARCLHTGAPLYSNRRTVTLEAGAAGEPPVVFERVALVPLAATGRPRPIGAILADNIFSGEEITADLAARLHGLANLAAVAIERARLHAQTVAMAEVDGLTGVYNRRHYERALDRALAHSRTTGRWLAMVVFDLDHFKAQNDRHGHLTGDQVLKEVSRIIADHVRTTDTVARYGGEEFVLLLPDTPAGRGARVAEKLCGLVRQTPLCRGLVRGLTLSAGVAATRGEIDREELFRRADAALYRAKAAGRDRVVLWDDVPAPENEQASVAANSLRCGPDIGKASDGDTEKRRHGA